MSTHAMNSGAAPFRWIRGVNLNGWLVLKRFITPYLFALTTCDLQGNFCQFQGQIGVNSSLPVCDMAVCQFVQTENKVLDPAVPNGAGWMVRRGPPESEFALLSAFQDDIVKTAFLKNHYANFITQADVMALAAAGVTHLKVPVGHWMVGDLVDFTQGYNFTVSAHNHTFVLPNATQEFIGPWLKNLEWPYLINLVDWIRASGSGQQIWLQMEAVPGWDRPGTDCSTWSTERPNVGLAVVVFIQFLQFINYYSIQDVVTGIVVLPSSVDLTYTYQTQNSATACDETIIEEYYNLTFAIAREFFGPSFNVIIGPAGVDPTIWNERKLWQNEPNFTNTFMSADYNQVYTAELRSLTEKQHVAYACQTAAKFLGECCFANNFANDTANQQPEPAQGIARIVGSFSGAYDTDVASRTDMIMQHIYANGVNPELNRLVSSEEAAFLSNFIKAQMVAYEMAGDGNSHGWFFETLKTEGGAFAEWDFLKGIQDGWIPNPLVSAAEPSDAQFGSCMEILANTQDTPYVVNPYPNTVPGEMSFPITDDVVQTQGSSLNGSPEAKAAPYDQQSAVPAPEVVTNSTGGRQRRFSWFACLAFILFILAVKRVFFNGLGSRMQQDYEPVRGIGLTV